MRPPPALKPKRLQQEIIFELPADTNRVVDGPFEIAALPLSAESQFDEQLQHTYVAYAAQEIQNKENNIKAHFESSGHLEQPLPPVSVYVHCYTLLHHEN
jgi:hypothetical protein